MKDSNDKLAWLYLGAALARSGNSKEATKAFRKSNYTFNDAAGDIDTPAKMTIKPRASYTEQARMNGQTGTVKIAVGLDADGTVGFILPFQTLPWGLTENAIAAAKAMRFKPAVKDGKSVSTVTVLSYSFDIY
ncbi:MAG: energy transducer TonB [Acidobacteriota bacterium]